MGGIAVVIPCRDAGRTLLEALESVEKQTRAPAETIVVDDGSEDAYTRQVLAALPRQRTRVVRTSAVGPATARNHGVRLTDAPYVMVLQAEDLLEPTCLEQAGARLDRTEHVDFVATGIRGFEGSRYVWTPPSCTLVDALARGIGHPSLLFRRRVFDRVGGFDAAAGLCLDQDFWISLIASGFRGAVVEEPLVACRVRRDSPYHHALLRGEVAATMEAVLRKHRAAVESLGPELLTAREAFALELRAHRGHLDHERHELQSQLALLDARIAAATTALTERGEELVDWGELRRLTPLSAVWGLDRGKPLDRYYIEAFLDAHREDIRGRVLEVKDPWYTTRFGGAQVTRADVLDVDGANPRATVVADLARADAVPSDTFDCFILTQTLHIIYDVRAALAHCCRLLKPGGVLLCTVPSVSRVNYEDGGRDRDYWRFTEASLRTLFLELFPPDCFEVTGFGNVLACVAFLHGLSPDELRREELDAHDPWFPLLFAVRAVKPAREC